MSRNVLLTLAVLSAGCHAGPRRTALAAVASQPALRFSEEAQTVVRVAASDGGEPVPFDEGLRFLLGRVRPSDGGQDLADERVVDYWVAAVEAGETAPKPEAAQVQASWLRLLHRAGEATGPGSWFDDDRVIGYWVAEVAAGRRPPAAALPEVQAAWFRLVASAYQQPSPTLRDLFLKEARERMTALELDRDRADVALQGG